MIGIEKTSSYNLTFTHYDFNLTNGHTIGLLI